MNDTERKKDKKDGKKKKKKEKEGKKIEKKITHEESELSCMVVLSSMYRQLSRYKQLGG